jgi:uncharacterized protein (TIGR03382 family)
VPIRPLAASAILALVLTPGTAAAWWDANWAARATLPLQNATVSTDIDGIVALVVLDPTRIDYAGSDPAGDDLRFVDGDDLTELSYDIEEWNNGGTSWVWVRIPRVEGTPTPDSIYMYWGNPAAPVGEDAVGTWDDGLFDIVFHMNGSNLNPVSGLGATLTGGALLVAGTVADTLDTDGVNDYLDLAEDLETRLEDPASIDFWIQTTDVGNADPFLAPPVTGYQESNKPEDTQLWGWLDGGGHIGMRYGNLQTVGTSVVNDGAWHHVALVRYADGDQQVWVDGVREANTQGVAGVDDVDFSSFGYDWIGRAGKAATFNYLDAKIDEVHVQLDPRSPEEWYEVDDLAQSGAFFTFCTLVDYAVDGDGDGYGDNGAVVASCDPPPGAAPPGDCDDGDPAVNPGEAEICESVQNDDEDCDGLIDENDPDAVGSDVFHEDLDGDGFGNPAVSVLACVAPMGFVADGTDCDDGDSTEFPGAIWYDDDDLDGYGDPLDSVAQCTRAAGHVDNPDDCDDTDGTLNPDTTWYDDTDGDGYGDPANATQSCTQPGGTTDDDTDCNDGSALVHPGAAEDCDGVDDDCDAAIDDNPAAPAGTLYYPDLDGDGYGGPGPTVRACSLPLGYFATSTDCDDGAAGVHPNAAEDACNGVDDDCDAFGGPTDDSDGDGFAFEDEDASGASDCDLDSDGDGVDDAIELPRGDSDGDGNDDAADPDDDGDSIPTIEEGSGNPDGAALNCLGVIPDNIPNYLDTDSDGDGLPDVVEGPGDLDGDFIPNYLDCYDFGCAAGVDGDEDGLDECTELDLGLDSTSDDTDGDSVTDGIEVGDPLAPADTDGDGTMDALDEDDDDDGVVTLLEDPDANGDVTADDTDGDATPNYLDDDDDGDGVPTAEEDRNGNGTWIDDNLDGDAFVDYLDGDDLDGPAVDADGDGLLNGEEAAVCGDDGCLDPLSTDTDGDGIDDATEVGDPTDPTDTDGDGTPDALDVDDDGDGVATAEEGPTDADADGLPAWLDPDSDGDGTDDGDESATDDGDCDGIPDRYDPIGFDGVCGGVETPPGGGPAKDAGCGCDSPGAGGSPLAVLGALALLRRRRRA